MKRAPLITCDALEQFKDLINARSLTGPDIHRFAVAAVDAQRLRAGPLDVQRRAGRHRLGQDAGPRDAQDAAEEARGAAAPDLRGGNC